MMKTQELVADISQRDVFGGTYYAFASLSQFPDGKLIGTINDKFDENVFNIIFGQRKQNSLSMCELIIKNNQILLGKYILEIFKQKSSLYWGTVSYSYVISTEINNLFLKSSIIGDSSTIYFGLRDFQQDFIRDISSQKSRLIELLSYKAQVDLKPLPSKICI